MLLLSGVRTFILHSKFMMFELTKEDIEEIADEYPSHVTIKVKAQDKKLYKHVKENYKGDRFTEKLYRFLYGNEDAVCDVKSCDEEADFFSFGRGFRDVCSRSCSAKKEESKEVKECVYCEEEMDVYKSENKKYCCHDCYINHRVEKEDFDEQLKKARESCREKYESMGFGSEKIREKIRETMVDRYNDKFYVNEKKRKETKEKKYGDPNYVNVELAKETKKEKYGDPNYSNRETAAQTRKQNKYRQLINSPKFTKKIEPLFEINEYDGSEGYVKYPFRCKQCEKEFQDYLYSGNVPRCPNCYNGWNYVGSSEKEKELADFIGSVISDQTELVRNDREVLDGKELDVYVPSREIAIEYNGLYWHSEDDGDTNKYYHLNKTKECEDKGVQLIHIFEPEWKTKQSIVKNRLKHILGCSDQSPVYARKCSVSEVSREKKRKFLDKYHLQGAGRSKIKLGLFHGEFFNSNLVAVMTFGTPSIAQGHKEEKRKQWEMKRYACSRPVVGGAGKLFKHFIRNYGCNRVKTYADRRWSTTLGNVYEKIGFEYKGSSNPNYFYFRKDGDGSLQHRFAFRKNVLNEKLKNFDPDLTEWENMKKHGYDRIWDCGHLRYVWKQN
jgi:hypothetical protein